jgi:hypothetical protein
MSPRSRSRKATDPGTHPSYSTTVVMIFSRWAKTRASARLQTKRAKGASSRPPAHPWNVLSLLDPAIFTRKCAAKRQEEVSKRNPIRMLTAIDVENSVPIWSQFNLFTLILPSSNTDTHCAAVDLSLPIKLQLKVNVLFRYGGDQ